jgi:hypothetical protein
MTSVNFHGSGKTVARPALPGRKPAVQHGRKPLCSAVYISLIRGIENGNWLDFFASPKIYSTKNSSLRSATMTTQTSNLSTYAPVQQPSFSLFGLLAALVAVELRESLVAKTNGADAAYTWGM